MLTQSQQSLKSTLDFIPADIEEKYQKSDLDYKYCVAKFSEMAAIKRDNIPIPTMKLWFIEFIKLDWNKYKFDLQYDALLSSDILGYAIRIDHWINAVKELSINQQAYEMFLPDTKKRSKKGLQGLREFLDGLDEKAKKERPYYIDRETKEKVYYPELPANYKGNFIAEWRRGDRIKTELRKK